MNKQNELNSLRTVVLSVLFLMYYGLIAVLCWPLLASHPEVVIRQMVNYKVLAAFLLVGFSAGALLFMSTIPAIELGFKGYWRARNWRGLRQVSLYSMSNLALALFPFFLARFGAALSKHLTPVSFLLSIATFLIIVTARRFQGLTVTGLPTCAH